MRGMRLKGLRGGQHEFVFVAPSDDLQTDGQVLVAQAAGHADGRMPRQAKGVTPWGHIHEAKR